MIEEHHPIVLEQLMIERKPVQDVFLGECACNLQSAEKVLLLHVQSVADVSLHLNRLGRLEESGAVHEIVGVHESSG